MLGVIDAEVTMKLSHLNRKGTMVTAAKTATMNAPTRRSQTRHHWSRRSAGRSLCHLVTNTCPLNKSVAHVRRYRTTRTRTLFMDFY
ncbi:MAG: hypothetical protein EBT09_04450 [Actinobacteria bacterium]|nr:hypothetical protein [Actinomycetota bacterium]